MSKPSAGHDNLEQAATPARYNELVAAFAGAATWLALLVTNGPLFGLQTLWLLLIAVGLGAWTLFRRLRFSRSSLRITLGPWSRVVDLTQLEKHSLEEQHRWCRSRRHPLRSRPVRAPRSHRGGKVQAWGRVGAATP